MEIIASWRVIHWGWWKSKMESTSHCSHWSYSLFRGSTAPWTAPIPYNWGNVYVFQYTSNTLSFFIENTTKLTILGGDGDLYYNNISHLVDSFIQSDLVMNTCIFCFMWLVVILCRGDSARLGQWKWIKTFGHIHSPVYNLWTKESNTLHSAQPDFMYIYS